MSIKKLLLKSAPGLAAFLAIILIAPTQAAVQPYVEGGDIYRVRNLTKGTDFGDPATADKCEELQYRIRIHNPGPDTPLENVTVKVVIPPAASTQNASTATVSATNASPSSVSDTATVNLVAAYGVSYVPGSSQLLGSGGNVISSINDVTSGAGVNIGGVGISVEERRFVQFKAKVDCPQPPVTPPEEPPVTPPVTPPTTPPTTPAPVKPADKPAPPRAAPQSQPQPTFLPAAGASSALAVFAGTSTLAAAGHYLVTRRLGRV